MSNTKSAAEEAPNNPAETVAQTEAPAKDEVPGKSNEKNAVADTAPDSSAKGDPADGRSEESSAKSDKNGAETKEQENGDSDKKRGSGRSDHKYDRYNKYDRDDKRKGSYSDRPRYRKSKTNEFADLPETDDPQEIRAQVEFYFSSANLSQDRHMFLEMKGAENRPVSIKHIASFKRMHRFQPYSAIVAALRDSNDLVVVDDGKFSGAGNEAVKRKEPITVPTRDDDDEMKPTMEELYRRLFYASQNKLDASVYVKGFGKEEDAGQIALENFFKPYGAIVVRKRRDEDDNWKGSVFVEFDSEDSQQQFLALDPKPKFNGNKLLILSKKEYSEKKCEEKGIIPAWKQEPGAGEGRREYRDRGRNGRGGGRGRGRGGHDRHDRHGGDRRYNGRRRDRSRSRSPRRSRRDRSDSRDSEDSRDWNSRRDRFQKSNYGRDKRDRRDRSRDRNGSSRKDKDNDDINVAKSIIRDADGVPIIQDTSKESSKSSGKRKADNDEEPKSPKKSKVEDEGPSKPLNKRKADDNGEEPQEPKKSKIEILMDA